MVRQNAYVTDNNLSITGGGEKAKYRLSLGYYDEQGTTIRMEVAVVHHLAGYYGLACREIDLDSVTHLRRLVALNLGDETLAEREFAQLTHS